MAELQRLVGIQLRIIRTQRKLTQEQLAEKTGNEGLSKSRVSDIERGKLNISLKTLELLLNTLDVSASQLFGFDDVVNSPELAEKNLLIKALSFSLQNRSTLEVKYATDSIKSFLEIIDYKEKYNL